MKRNREAKDYIDHKDRICKFAVEVFGSEKKASKWFATPNKAFKNYYPKDLLATAYGIQTIESILGRIQHGIYS